MISSEFRLPGAEFAVNRGERGRPPAGFASTLESHMPQETKREQVREAAEQLVASAFIVPVLASMRETSKAAGPFAPGTVERRFGPLLDQHLADRITQASRFTLVDAIVDRYAPKGIE
jgi:Rod binding domain-containing protein